MSLDHPGGQAEPARPFLIGDAVRLRVAAQEQRRMGHGSRRWEWYGAEFALVPERVAGYHEGGAFTAPFQVQPERLRELLTVVTPRTATHPVRFSLVKVSSVHDPVSSTSRRRIRRLASGSASTWRSHARGSAATSAAPKFAMTCSRRACCTARVTRVSA